MMLVMEKMVGREVVKVFVSYINLKGQTFGT